MTPEATTAVDAPDTEVMASVDSSSPRSSELIIADITRDDAWLSMRTAEAPVLAEWC
ncbi:DUF7556 family protein [Haloprofundus salilacus]|uniref:DUF7556 family protein n=1 Tax=Haloprofundus salilacus TaxID=2876190 RepID=UPI001CCF1872|nr:hypothetical protein [Haloprofundus salilacus]